MDNFYTFLKTCSLVPGDICQVVGGYAETYRDLINNNTDSYHRIPPNINVKVIDVDEDCATVEAIFIHAESGERKTVKQTIERNDLVFVSSCNN